MGEGETVTIEKEMALTHAGFWRAIEKALGTDTYEKTATGVVLNSGGGKRLEITLGSERERRIALMVIEIMDVTLTFIGYSDGERDAALSAFDRAYQRGGG